ncbi:hypothetical protein OAL98_04025 [Gammaproteobacteria bacterium]|nr:hypothetical protein [Gammaproteobacteria bacterium]
MIICPDYKLCFIQVPHTASTDIADFLLSEMGGIRVLAKHSLLPEFKFYFPKEYKTYYVLGGLRDPFLERISIFNKYESDHGGRYSTTKPKNGRMHSIARDQKIHREILSGELDFNEYFKKYCRYTFYSNVYCLKERFNAFYKLENIQSDLQDIFWEVGYKSEFKIKKENTSVSRRPIIINDWYSDDSLRKASLLYRRYCIDFSYEMPLYTTPTKLDLAKEYYDHQLKRLIWLGGMYKHRKYYES